jgi:DNA-binding NtrC family response regulator
MENKSPITTVINGLEEHKIPHMLNDEKIRIAVIDDDEDDYLFISDFIRNIEGKEFVIDWFRSYDSALQIIRNRSYHIYFVDYFLDTKTGIDLLKEAAAIKLNQPIILLTGFGNRAMDIRAMELGAMDYMVKSELNTEKLERCIRYALERAAFLEELKSREMKYRNLFEGSKDAVFYCQHRPGFCRSESFCYFVAGFKRWDTYRSYAL